ncbi:MAG: AAA family ATPase [Campylobacterales bacterium]|nr:AAA family ATPase [Campylobacterales bacterium]
MNEYFIQKLFIKDVRGIIKDLEIPLGQNERKHLIITGKNGSGKTSLLNEIDSLLNKLINNQFAQMKNLETYIKNAKQAIKNYNINIENYQKEITTLETQKK